jgi:hypothetical protein
MRSGVSLCLLPASLLVSMVFFVTNGCAQMVPPRDQWNEQNNSPGATLNYKETGRSLLNGKTVVAYNLFTSGLPRDVQYVLSTAPLGAATPIKIRDVRLTEDGNIVNATADPEHNIVAGEPLPINLLGAKGQPFQFAVVSADGRLRAFTRIIPFPIEADTGPCHLSVEELMIDYEGILILLKGLQSNEAIVLKCNCGKKGHETKGTADAQGTFIAAVDTRVKGKQSGTFEFELKAQSCKIGMQVPWGKGADKLQ